jgi:hypothetical protein
MEKMSWRDAWRSESHLRAEDLLHKALKEPDIIRARPYFWWHNMSRTIGDYTVLPDVMYFNDWHLGYRYLYFAFGALS